MAKELNEEEDFWDFKSNQVKSPPFEVKSKKDEFNINNKKEEINNNNQKQSEDNTEADDKGVGGADDRSFRIEKLIKSLEKLKPAHLVRDEISESQRSNTVNDDKHSDSLTNENKINSKNGITYATTDSDGSGSDGKTHGTISRDKKGKRDLKLDDGKSNDNNTDRSADEFGHHKEGEEVVPAHASSWSHRSNDPDDTEAKTMDGYDTFVDYGFPDEETQLKRDSLIDDGLMVNEDSEEKTFKVHPPKSGDPRRSRRQTRKPNADAKTSKSSHHRANDEDFDNQRQAKDDDDDDDDDNEGESCDEIQNRRLSQETESSGEENASTPKATDRRRSRNQKRGSTQEDSGKDGTGGETDGSRSPPRLRKGLRSGDYDWSLSGNETMREWVKQKNRIARKQKAEDKRKERIKKQEEAEGNMTGLVGDRERKSVESLERKKKQKPKQRSNSCPGDGGVGGDRKVLPRSRSQPRMSKELRSGGFDWSTSKNEEIRVWLKKKKRLIRKKRAEERKKEKMKKKEEEQKRREHEEMYADSSERVSEWMKLKRRQEYLQRRKQREEEVKAVLEKEKVMVIGRRMNYEPASPTEKQVPEKREEPTSRMDQKQDDPLKAEQPLLKQREKQRRLLLSAGPKQPINRNKTLNLSRLSKEKERKEMVSKHPANHTQQHVNTVEEITLPKTETITSLPSTDRRSSLVKTPNRRLNEAVVLPRQSLSPSKVNVPTGNVKVGTDPENIKKKITFDEWLRIKKTNDERKKVSGQAAKEQGKNVEELNKSVEVLKINLAPEKRSVPTGSVENLSKRAIRPKSASRQQQPKQPQVRLEQETVKNQRQDLPENKPSQATIDNVSDVSQLMAEASKNSPRPSRPSSSKRGIRSSESDKMAASERATDKVPDLRKVGAGNIPASVLRAKSPKPRVAVRPTLRSVNYQQGSWEKFSEYMWDQVNEEEGGELITTNRDKPMGAEAEITEASFERKTEKPEDSFRQDKKVEASADFHGGSEFRESRLDMNSELNGSENIGGEIIRRMPQGHKDDIHTIIDAEEEETETELDDERRAELKMDTKVETRREIQMESQKSEEHGHSHGIVDKVRGMALPPRSSPGHHVRFSGSEEDIMSDLEILGSDSSK